MKLSEMNGEQLSDALCRLAGPVGAVMTDPALGSALQAVHRGQVEGAPLVTVLGRLIQQAGPGLLGEHRQDVCAILGILTGRAPADILLQSGLLTLRQLRQCWDEDLALFFSCADPADPTK